MAEIAMLHMDQHEVDIHTAWAIEKFLVMEARLLDEENYDAWLAMLDPGIRYVMPVPQNAYRKNRGGSTTLAPALILDETLPSLRQRAKREGTGLVWLNDPPTRHVRIVTNIESRPGEAARTFEVNSKLMLFRSRRERDQVSHVVWREDVLLKTDAGFRIAKRTINLMDRVIVDKNLNMFF
jgi:ethylbenzene dioxygenase subunit beta